MDRSNSISHGRNKRDNSRSVFSLHVQVHYHFLPQSVVWATGEKWMSSGKEEKKERNRGARKHWWKWTRIILKSWGICWQKGHTSSVIWKWFGYPNQQGKRNKSFPSFEKVAYHPSDHTECMKIRAHVSPTTSFVQCPCGSSAVGSLAGLYQNNTQWCQRNLMW